MPPRLLKGANPTPRHLLAAAMPHVATTPTPPQFLWLPKQLNLWGNGMFGDCCTAEEAFAKACNFPEIFIPPAKIVKWARNHFVLNGAGLYEVLQLMQTIGIDHDLVTYKDGPFHSVNWMDVPLLQNAIAQGPVKIGVASDHLIQVPNIGVSNGWIATGLPTGDPLDHCISLAGYGPASWLATQLGATLPAEIAGDTPMYAAFTWSTVGLIDPDSVSAITGEAWLRTPTTISKPD